MFAVKHPRWEPYAGKPHVRICAGGAQQWASLPRSSQALLAMTINSLHKNGRDCSRPYRCAKASPYFGGAVPGGGGGSEAVPPLSSGVMRRMVTRRLIRLGPSVCSFGYCEP
jgi:hypothetical protein